MATLGFGLAPAGTSLAGFGAPAGGTDRAGYLLRDSVNGRSQGGRYIDPVTRRYTFDADGRHVGMNGLRQRVQLALSTDEGSSAIRDLGNRLRSIKRITPTLNREARDTVLQALSHLTTSGELEILEVRVTKVAASSVVLHVRCRDLSTGLEFTERVR